MRKNRLWTGLMSAGMISSEEYGAALDALNAEEAALGLGIESTTVAVEEQNVAMKSASGQAFRFRGLYGTISEGLNFMMTPLGLVVAGLAGVGGSMVYAAQKTDDLHVALIATGDAAGVSDNEIEKMRDTLEQSGATINDATAALVTMAQSGRFVGQSLEKAAQAAVNMASVTGESIK
ncbi:secreted protein, partial [mine drainage metagenome]